MQPENMEYAVKDDDVYHASRKIETYSECNIIVQHARKTDVGICSKDDDIVQCATCSYKTKHEVCSER